MTTLMPTPNGYSWRPLRYDDLPTLHALFVATHAVDGYDRVDPLADLQTQFDDPWSDPEADSLVGFTPDGKLVAFARCFMHPEPQAEAWVDLWLDVHPDHRQPALQGTLFDWGEARGRERLQAAPAGLPRSLRIACQDNVQYLIRRAEARGFTPLRYFYRMRRDLRQAIPEAPLPNGFTFCRFTPEIDRPLLEAFNDSFRDHWSFESVTREDWEKFFLQRESFRPDLTLLALADGEVAAFSFNTVETRHDGGREGQIAELGTRRPWRKRGLASALLCESLRLFRAEGLDCATLGVDTQNPSGALGLYERLGFEPHRRFIVFHKPCAA